MRKTGTRAAAIPMPALAPVERPLLLLAVNGRGVELDEASTLVGEAVE